MKTSMDKWCKGCCHLFCINNEMVRLKVVALVSQELKTDLKIYLLFRNETHRFSSTKVY